jgi:hypothetical protein
MYCQPDHLSLTPEQLIDMLSREIGTNNQLGTFPFGIALLSALVKVFPCTAAKL